MSYSNNMSQTSVQDPYIFDTFLIPILGDRKEENGKNIRVLNHFWHFGDIWKHLCFYLL